MEKKPNFISPKKDYGNFVQLYLNREPYIRFSKQSDEHHKNLLKKILDEFEINWFKSLDGKAELKGINYEANYEVVGMGQFIRVGNDIFLIGRSIDYDLTPSEKCLKDLSSYLPPKLKINIS